MKKSLILLSLISLSLMTSCNKEKDEFETNRNKKTTNTQSYCKNTDNALVKIYQSVLGKDNESIKSDIKYGLDLYSKMNIEFRKKEENKDKILYFKLEPTITSDKGLEEFLISIHISNTASVPGSTRTLYTGSEGGAKHFISGHGWSNLLNLDPCSPYMCFGFDGVWYVEDCC